MQRCVAKIDTLKDRPGRFDLLWLEPSELHSIETDLKKGWTFNLDASGADIQTLVGTAKHEYIPRLSTAFAVPPLIK